MTPEELWKKSGLSGTYGIFEYGSDDPEALIQLTMKGISHCSTGVMPIWIFLEGNMQNRA